MKDLLIGVDEYVDPYNTKYSHMGLFFSKILTKVPAACILATSLVIYWISRERNVGLC